MPHRAPHRAFTARENRIADGIRRGLSYREIGGELAAANGRATPIAPETIRKEVITMAELFDRFHEFRDELTPRQVVLVYAVERELQQQFLREQRPA